MGARSGPKAPPPEAVTIPAKCPPPAHCYPYLPQHYGITLVRPAPPARYYLYLPTSCPGLRATRPGCVPDDGCSQCRRKQKATVIGAHNCRADNRATTGAGSFVRRCPRKFNDCSGDSGSRINTRTNLCLRCQRLASAVIIVYAGCYLEDLVPQSHHPRTPTPVPKTNLIRK